VVLGLTIALAMTKHAPAGDGNWPRFRGPNGAGVSDDVIPAVWTEKDYAWKIEVPGKGHSSPVVWGDSVFVTAADEDAGERSLLCVNAADGAIRWRHKVALKPFKISGENSYASSTPAVDEKHVYVQWTTGDQFSVVAVRHDGSEAWKADLGLYRTEHGGVSSPIAHGDLVFVHVDQEKLPSSIAALDRESGAIRWRIPRNNADLSTSTPCIYHPTSGPEQLIYTTNANGFTSLDPATGGILWELPGTFTKRVVSSPIIVGALVLGAAGVAAKGECVIAVKPPGVDGVTKPTITYKLTQDTPYVPTSIVYRDWLFTWNDHGTIACHKAATGEQIWSGRLKGSFFGSPVCAAGKLYCVSKRGEVVVVNASGQKFEQIATNKLGEASNATPAISNGRMYVRTLSHLICIRGEAAPGTIGGSQP
jgi:outer membrane protein assembly factor BamB